MKPFIVFLLTLLISTHCFAQTTCDTIPVSVTKQLDNYSPKKFSKIMRRKKTTLTTLYNVATYFRLKGDTATAKQWYMLSADKLKQYWQGCDKNRQRVACLLFTTGKVYYYLNDYANATTYFTKAIVAKCPDDCINYFLSLTKPKN